MHRIRIAGLALAAAGCTVAPPGDTDQAIVARHIVQVLPSGELDPPVIFIDDGDTVEWRLHDTRDTIVSRAWPAGSAWPAVCESAHAMAHDAPSSFAVPPVIGAAGVHINGATNEHTPAHVWASEEVNGVFLRVSWNAIDRGPGVPAEQRYDWSALDRELDQAVASGKVVSLGVKAGLFGTPDWLFNTDVTDRGLETPRTTPNAGVDRVLVSSDGDIEVGVCDQLHSLGDPGQVEYQEAYEAMLTALGAHVRSNNAWYRAIAYVKLSGANSETHENELPRRCGAGNGCLCNPERWSDAGYRPAGLFEFYRRQGEVVAAAFPGKSMSYMLLHDGFPRVNATGDYLVPAPEGQAGAIFVDIDPTVGPTVFEENATYQTREVIGRLQTAHRHLLHVQNNALNVGPSPTYLADHYAGAVEGECRYLDQHPVGGPRYDQPGSGCPNEWVLYAGWWSRQRADPWTTLTGFQVRDGGNGGPRDAAELDRALDNAWRSSDAVLLEIYAGDGSRQPDEPLDPDGTLTLGDWDQRFAARRRDDWSSPELPDPRPLTVSRTFHRSPGVDTEVFTYINGTRCGDDDPATARVEHQVGAVVVTDLPEVALCPDELLDPGLPIELRCPTLP